MSDWRDERNERLAEAERWQDEDVTEREYWGQKAAVLLSYVEHHGMMRGSVAWAVSVMLEKMHGKASREWYGGWGGDRGTQRLWLIRNRLIESADCTAEEIAFMLAFLDGKRSEDMPPYFLTHELFQGYWPVDSHKTEYDTYDTERAFGNVKLTTEGIAAAREKVRAAGLLLPDDERLARARRRMPGTRKVAKLIGAEHYWPLIGGCPLHLAPLRVADGRCTVCNQSKMDEWYGEQPARDVEHDTPEEKQARADATATAKADAKRSNAAERAKRYRARKRGEVVDDSE